jgi:DNA-binding transcriptional ArsR family regulator
MMIKSNKTKQDSISALARLLSIAGDKSRLKILCLIFNQNGVCVSDIAKKLNMSVAIISHHLQVMAREGLLEPIKDGKRTCYLFKKNGLTTDLKRFICKYK